MIVPTLVITEVTYLLGSRLGVEAEVRFLGDLDAGNLLPEPVLAADWLRHARSSRPVDVAAVGDRDDRYKAVFGSAHIARSVALGGDQREFQRCRRRSVSRALVANSRSRSSKKVGSNRIARSGIGTKVSLGRPPPPSPGEPSGATPASEPVGGLRAVGCFERLDLVVGEHDIECGDGVGEVVGFGRADDR